ncbi:polysaccharide pyruvyl transferase family protein [Brevundimonas sp.]|uniref:polysaccharide pyruvyl transferase family protein n=1 Tax=Brevundimonas sp. TaxID=1871086 RepID=UPI003BAC154C
MKNLLIRASKAPFDNWCDGSIPTAQIRDVYKALAKDGTKNAGNLVFAHSTYKALSAPDTTLTVDDYRLSGDDAFVDEADRLNERYDAFIIPLCNSFRVSYGDSIARMTRTIRKLKIPCIVTGVGAQTSLTGSFDQLEPIRTEVYEFVSAILDRSASISVRGEYTRDYLLSLGFGQDQVDVIGCPSMFYNGRRMAVSKKPGGLDKIALNLSNIAKPQLKQITGYFNEHSKGVTFIPQVRLLMKEIYLNQLPLPGAPDLLKSPVPNLRRQGQVKFFFDVMPWMDFMREQSFTVGTRIHGNVVSLLADTPAHVIAHDSRTLELARYFEIPHSILTEMDGFDAQDVYDRSDFTNLNANHGKRLDIYARFLEKNGLAHILYDDEKLAAHDARVRASLTDARFREAA